MKKSTLLILILFVCSTLCVSARQMQVICKSGDGIYVLLQRYGLKCSESNYNRFKELNPKKVKKNGELFRGLKYNMPVKRVAFDGETIRGSIGTDDINLALKIQKYNETLLRKKLISRGFKQSKILYVPDEWAVKIAPKASEAEVKTDFVQTFANIEKIDHSMKGRVFYLSPGHGGPDPGAMGEKDGYSLCEDEYAYDITMRLGRCLAEHDATVYVIIKDKNDGIRDTKYLTPSNNEVYITNEAIDGSQTTRLLKRADIVNSLYDKFKKTAKSQTVLMIHVDSRYQDKRIDIFYYYNKGSEAGRKLAHTMYKTVKQKYEKNQPGRGYYGSISTRELLELRKTKPVGVYIELGNIQNPNDQIRLIDPNNRQAIANWLFLGLKKGTK